jgi:glycosyltransferase involved in cell wall biosynthesis
MKISELSQTFDRSSIRTVLLLPFEDQEVLNLAAREFPQATQHVIRKEDLAGLSPARVIARVRQMRVDLVIASLGNSAVRRNLSAIQLIVGLSRGRHRIVRIGEDNFTVVSRARLTSRILPSLLAALVLGLGCAAWTSWLLLYYRFAVQSDPSSLPMPDSTKRSKRILYIRCDLAGSVQTGGSATHITEMVLAFRRAGLEVVYLADQRLESLPSEVVQISVSPLASLGIFDEFQLLAFNLQLTRRLRYVIRDVRPDFIYQRHAVFSFAAGAVARKARLPLVLEVNASEVWVKRRWSRLWFDGLATRCERLALRLADVLAVISTAVREQLVSYRLPDGKFLLTPNGVNPEVFRPDIDGLEVRKRFGWDRETVVGFIGTFTRWHGVETLFDAAILALQRNPNLRFLLIGDGDLRTALEQQAESRGLKEFLLFTGLIPHTEAPLYLAACDILVSPHLGFQDGTKFFGSPTKLFEYMAMGRAIIASRLEQIAEVIRDGQNGLLMNPGDDRQLAELILQLASDHTLRLHLGQRAREDVVAHYTWDQNVRRILQFLTVPRS